MRMRDEDGHHAMLEAGKAWRRIKLGQKRLWSDWTMVIGPGLLKARSEAMALAGTNQPMGRGYNTAMAGLLKEYGLGDMGETARAHMLKIMERYAEVEEWRARQKDPGDLNHPSRVWAKFQAASRRVDERHQEKAGTPSLAKQTADELAAAIEDNAAKDQEIAALKAHVAELEAARELPAYAPPKHVFSREGARKQIIDLIGLMQFATSAGAACGLYTDVNPDNLEELPITVEEATRLLNWLKDLPSVIRSRTKHIKAEKERRARQAG